MWVKIKNKEDQTRSTQYINTDKIESMLKYKRLDGVYDLYIHTNEGTVSVYRDTEAEIDKIIQALIGNEIKEV